MYYVVKLGRHHSEVYTYYCKEVNLTFQVLEKDTFHILVFDDKDSVFIPRRTSGQYLGVQFYIPEESNEIYFEMTAFCSTVYRYVENKYKIKFVQADLLKEVPNHNDCKHFRFVGAKFINPYIEIEQYKKHVHELCVDSSFWGIYGDCDQGKYTFGVMRGKKYYGSLEPLEWENDK